MTNAGVPSEVDVVVVGARVAGCVTAALFADAGLSVLVVDRAPLPSSTLSTHFFRGNGLGSVLQTLELVDDVLALGTPPLVRQWTSVGNADATESGPQDPGALGYALSVRRAPLDAVLADRARRAGASIVDRCRVDDVVMRAGAVIGVRVADRDVACRLVVGADGRHSAVAKAVAASYEAEEPGHRGLFYCYVEGWTSPAGDEPDAAEFSLLDDEMAYVFPSDGGATCVALTVSKAAAAELRVDLQDRFFDAVAKHEALAARVRQSTPIERVVGAGPEPNYVRAATGPGWALVGDAGQHQDPWSGLGMDLASTHAVALARAYAPWLRGETTEAAAAASYRAERDDRGREQWRSTVVGSRYLGG